MAITCNTKVSSFYRFNKIFNGLTTKIYSRCIPFFAKVRYGIVTIVLFRVSMYCSALGMHWLNLQWPRNFCSVLSMVVCGPKLKGSLQRLLKVSQTSRSVQMDHLFDHPLYSSHQIDKVLSAATTYPESMQLWNAVRI